MKEEIAIEIKGDEVTVSADSEVATESEMKFDGKIVKIGVAKNI